MRTGCRHIRHLRWLYCSCQAGHPTVVTAQTNSCCTSQTGHTNAASAIQANYAAPAKPASQLSSQRGVVPAISTAHAGYAASAVPAATNSMALAEPATYIDYAAAVASAAQAGFASPASWAMPYEFAKSYEERDAVKWMPDAPPDDNNMYWLAGYPCSATNCSSPTESQDAVLPPSTSDPPFVNYPVRSFPVALCKPGECEPPLHTI